MVNLLKICSHFKPPTDEEINAKAVEFGVPTRGKLLVLDMDETLIHAKFLKKSDSNKDDGDFVISLADNNNEEDKISVKMRPFLDNCLEHLAKLYEIAVFTAGEQQYADTILDYIDEEREIIKHRLYR